MGQRHSVTVWDDTWQIEMTCISRSMTATHCCCLISPFPELLGVRLAPKSKFLGNDCDSSCYRSEVLPVTSCNQYMYHFSLLMQIRLSWPKIYGIAYKSIPHCYLFIFFTVFCLLLRLFMWPFHLEATLCIAPSRSVCPFLWKWK